MNIESELKTKGISVQTVKFNSNNSWGFGGAIGKRFKFTHNNKEYCITEATACYRHIDSHKFITMTVDGTRIIDEFTSKGNKLLTKFFETI